MAISYSWVKNEIFYNGHYKDVPCKIGFISLGSFKKLVFLCMG